MSYVIVSHDSCPDGFGSYFWLRRSMEIEAASSGSEPPDIVHLPGRYGEAPDLEAMTGKTVFCVDFCYPSDELDAICEVAKNLIVLDHHETAVGYVDGSRLERYDTVGQAIDDVPNLYWAVIDQDHSGVGIVGEYCGHFDGELLPPWLQYVEDRDLWRFTYGPTRNVFAAVTSRPYTLEAWGEMHEMGAEALEREGRVINRYRDQLIEQVAASSFDLFLRDDNGSDWDIPCASSPYAIGSDVAGKLAEASDDGIGAYVILHADHVQVGLRSRKNGPNVATIAERYGGGGHPGASGLKLTWESFFEATR